MKTPDQTLINQLAMLAALERSFVDAYEASYAAIDDPYVRQQLEECQRSHQMRVDIIGEEIEDLGGEHDTTTRDEDIVLGEKVTGEAATLARLEQLEDHGLASYRLRLGPDAGIDFDIRDLIEGDMVPEQERTHAILSSLQQEH